MSFKEFQKMIKVCTSSFFLLLLKVCQHLLNDANTYLLKDLKNLMLKKLPVYFTTLKVWQ